MNTTVVAGRKPFAARADRQGRHIGGGGGFVVPDALGLVPKLCLPKVHLVATRRKFLVWAESDVVDFVRSTDARDFTSRVNFPDASAVAVRDGGDIRFIRAEPKN